LNDNSVVKRGHMCRQVSRVCAAVIFMVVALGSVNASANGVNTLSDVSFSNMADRIDVRITPKFPIPAQKVSASTEGSLLILRFDGSTARRRWVKANDADIKRVLVHPLKGTALASNVRIRFKASIPASVLKNIRVRAEGSVLIAAIPRTEKIALHWQGASTTPQKVAPVASKPKAVSKAKSIVAPTKVSADALVGPVLPGSDIKLEDSGSKDEEQNLESTSNGLAQPDLDSAGKGVVIVATLFLGLIGLVFWKKMRAPTLGSNDGPMIKPVGTHMLGPKQGLLLVDVAGQMVLLGTSDKGVQMLTKIENENGVVGEDIASRVNLNGQEVPESALNQAGKEGFAARFGRALERIRGASNGRNSTPKYGLVADQVQAEAATGYDPLSAMAGQVSDVTPGDTNRRTSRRQFDPVQPRIPEPAHYAQPPVDDQDALLAKLRSLQSA
jgi:flagellar biogenesis protein FliO